MKQREKLWTPGPWGTGWNNGLSGDVVSWGCYLDETECHQEPVHSDKEAVCVIYHGKPDKVHKANAQLISAAPDLVEALERIVYKNDAGSVAQAKAALAKAYGDSQ